MEDKVLRTVYISSIDLKVWIFVDIPQMIPIIIPQNQGRGALWEQHLRGALNH